jgi:hypothetical protein
VHERVESEPETAPAVAAPPPSAVATVASVARLTGPARGGATRLGTPSPPADPAVLVRAERALARAVIARRPGAEPPRRRLARIFERPDAQADAAGAKKAIKEFEKLSTADRETELLARYPTGDLTNTLDNLPISARLDPDIASVMLQILNWIEGYEARTTTGKTDAELAQLQADFLKAAAKKKVKPPPDWGGAAPGKTRFANLKKPAQDAWTKRGEAAIKKMAAFCTANNPELGVTEPTFELAFDAVDQSSLGAIAIGGTQEGKTVQVGFEFVLAVEMDEKYALSTVVHELYGHPGYDPTGTKSYEEGLYQQAVKLTPAGTVKDKTGTQTYKYWPSEIYSLLKEVSYFTPVTAADQAKSVALPDGKTTTMDQINYDPAGMVETWLKLMKNRWDPAIIEGLLRGVYKRLRNDPSQTQKAMNAFETAVTNVFGAATAANVTK